MTTLTEIIKADAAYLKDVTVNVDNRFGTVCISAPGKDDIFMQGDDASGFIKVCRDLWERAGDIDMPTVELAVAKDYVDCIWG